MTTPPRLRLVHGSPPPGPGDARGDDDANPPPPDSAIDAGFPDAAGAAPADADPAAAAARAARLAAIARQVVAGLAGFQFLASLRYLHWYAAMVRDGAVSSPALLAVPACVALYVATGLLIARRAPAACRTLFVLAAMALAVSVPFWGITEDWTWPLELGATLALAGAWYTRPSLTPPAAPGE
jgi:hypothetical protein